MSLRRERLAAWFPGAPVSWGRFGPGARLDERHVFYALAFAHRRDIRGLIDEHAAPDQSMHACSVWFVPGPEGVNAWTVGPESPLTLSPSLLCPYDGCDDHGFIREGTWVAA